MRAYDPMHWKADYTGSEPGQFKDWAFNDDGAEVPDALRFWREDLAANDDYGVVTVPGYGCRPPGEPMDREFGDDYAMQWIWDEPHCGLRPPSSRRASGRPSPVQAAP